MADATRSGRIRATSLGRLHQIDERMPDELHRHAGLAVDGLLERKDDEHAIGKAADRLQPCRAPGPDLRADVIDHGHAKFPDPRGEPEVEVGRVDHNQGVRAIDAGGVNEPPQRGKRTGHLRNRFGEARHRDVAIIVDQTAAGRLELRTAEARNRQRVIERTELARERSRVQIARRLAARQEQTRTQEAGRLNCAGSIGVLIFTSVAWRSTVCGPSVRDAVNGI